MAGGIDWFRWHHGSVTDQKFGLVAKKAGASVAEVIATWACLLEKASAADDRGNPGEVDFEAIDYALGMDDGKARRIYERMRERLLLDAETGRIAAWEKRQPKRERTDDNSTERVAKHRATKRQETPDGDYETPCNATKRQETPDGDYETPCNATKRQETPRGEESREEKSRGELSRAPRGSRLTLESLPDDWRAWAKTTRPDLDPAAVWDRFADYWRAKPGSSGVKLDWLATWRNWVREQRVTPTIVKPKPVAEPWAGAI